MIDRRELFSVFIAAALTASCRESSPKKLRLALDWKPEPEFGGFYAADYKKHGLNVEILPGGAGTPTIQMVGADSAEFGITSSDQIVVARARGNDVVAIFAVYQNSPSGIMVHASRGLKTIGDVLSGGTLAIQKGLPWVRLLERKYGFDKVRIVPSPTGDVSAFLRDEMFAQQCFINSEPLTARHLGADVQVFPISDTGYNPYTTVLTTSGDLLRNSPAIVQSMVDAVREGWKVYLADPSNTNRLMNELNPTMSPEVFTEVAEAQKALISPPGASAEDLGRMKRERWESLIGQLKELGDIPESISPDSCFGRF